MKNNGTGTKKKVEWQTVVDVKSDILFLSLNSFGLQRKYIKRALDIDYEYKSLYYFDNTVAYSKEDLDNFFNLVKEKLSLDQRYLFTFPKRVYRPADDLIGFSKDAQKITCLEKYPNSELQRIFTEYLEKAANAFPLVVISIPIEVIIMGELEKFLREKLKERGELEKFDEYFQALTQRTAKKTYFQEDYAHLLQLGKEIQENKGLFGIFQKNDPTEIVDQLKKSYPSFFQDLLGHNFRYSWINMYCFRRNPFTLEELMGRLKEVLEKDCSWELKNLERKRKTVEKNFQDTLRVLKAKGEIKEKVEILSEYIFLRTYRLDIFTYSAYLIRNLLLEIASRLGLAYEELIHLTLWEIKDALTGMAKVRDFPIKKRMESYAAIQIDGKFEIIVDKKRLKELCEEKEKTTQKKIRIIKGNVACRGKVSGPVRIVMHPTQIVKVQKGDVLVAPMTSPDFVVGMLKAVAIVTDHGGVTCHAAIVSRELGIPCIVGTGNATKILRDDEIVEVDAEEGIVRVIE
jgi:phosphohistidine swiveling domain-containing protein